MASELSPGDVTRLLRQAGSAQAAAELIPLVYSELRSIARRRLRSERPDHTLQPTALVNEVYLKLVGGTDKPIPWADRRHFFAVAANTMRLLLLEHARNRNRQKRGGGKQRLPISVVDLASQDDGSEEIYAVDEAIQRLAEQDPQLAELVRLRFFAGLTNAQIAELQGSSERTVQRDWKLAKAWLTRELGACNQADPAPR